MAIVLKSKSSKVSRIYDDQVIEAVKSYTFTAKKDFGTCDISSKKISKGDKCEMLILEDGTKVTTLLSTTIAKGKKAGKVQSTSIPSKKVAKPIAKAIKKTTAKATPLQTIVSMTMKRMISYGASGIDYVLNLLTDMMN